MNRHLSYALVAASLVGAFAACDVGRADDDISDGDYGGGATKPGDGAGPGLGVGGEAGDPDVVILDSESNAGGLGAGNGGEGPGGGAGGAGPPGDPPIPDACLPFQYAAPVAFALGPSDSHSTGSAAYAHELLAACKAPAPGVLETSHFINLHDLGYVHTDGQLSGYLGLLPTDDPSLFVVQGAAVAGADLARPAVHLTFVVDTSGSTADGAMARQIAALEATKAQLSAGDTIAIFGWSGSAVLERTDGGDQGSIESAIQAVSTDAALDGALAEGLGAAFGSAKAGISAEGEHSVIVLTDGGEPLNSEIQTSLLDISNEARLSFLGVGVGPAESYSPALLRDMTSLAGGKLHFLGADAGFDAQSLFGDGFQRLFNVAARSAVLQLTMPAYFEIVEAPQGVYAGDVSQLRQLTLAPGGTMLFRQTVKVCHPDIVNVKIPSMTGEVTFDRPTFGASEGATSHSTDVSFAFPISISANSPDPAANTEALITFADALRGPVEARLQAASSFIEGSTAIDAGLRSQLGQLLKRHPNHPTTECVQ